MCLVLAVSLKLPTVLFLLPVPLQGPRCVKLLSYKVSRSCLGILTHGSGQGFKAQMLDSQVSVLLLSRNKSCPGILALVLILGFRVLTFAHRQGISFSLLKSFHSIQALSFRLEFKALTSVLLARIGLSLNRSNRGIRSHSLGLAFELIFFVHQGLSWASKSNRSKLFGQGRPCLAALISQQSKCLS